MTKIEQYARAKETLIGAQRWANMIGQKYHGGGGGFGHLHEVAIKATLYFQETDGAINYHDCPEVLTAKLADAATEHFAELVHAALGKLEADCRMLAKEATAEHERLMVAAGLTGRP